MLIYFTDLKLQFYLVTPLIYLLNNITALIFCDKSYDVAH